MIPARWSRPTKLGFFACCSRGASMRARDGGGGCGRVESEAKIETRERRGQLSLLAEAARSGERTRE
jgi:hypothetical protein